VSFSTPLIFIAEHLSWKENIMAKLLVHIHSHPEMKNNVTMGLLVAVTGMKEGHDVEMFFAADGVHLLNCKNEGEIVGQGTGDVKLHLDALTEGNVKMFVSGMSSKARGYDESLLEGYNAEFAMPDTLIKRSINADSVLCY
jgi:predicted peroxiredoxin